jgi:D-aminopeptidase
MIPQKVTKAAAAELIVRDSHGSAHNILPDQLHPEAEIYLFKYNCDIYLSSNLFLRRGL